MIDNQTLEDQVTKAPEKIRPELNIEKWPIWQPAKSKNPLETRILEREVVLADGNRVKARVEVAPSTKGALTTEDQKTYYALVKIWEEQGYSGNLTFLSLRRLAKLLHKKWGTNVIESLSESLTRLRITHFIWKNSYYNSVTKETLEELDPNFTLLTDLKIVKRERDGHITKEASYFKFHDAIIRNLLHNYTKPLLLDVVLGFKSEIAQILYIHLDLVLASKNHYKRLLKKLFDDLGLKGKDYTYPSHRKRILEKALPELQGSQLTTGFISSAIIEKTRDGSDYKAVFQKRHLPLVLEVSEALPGASAKVEAQQTQTTFSAKDPDTLKAEEAEARLNTLSEEERQVLRERMTAKVLKEYPILEDRTYWSILNRFVNLAMKKEFE